MRRGLAALALLALAGCATQASLPSQPPAPIGRAANVIEPAGLGPVDIGMSIAEANAALGQTLVGDEPLDAAESCQTWHLGAGVDAPVYYMAQQGRITRVSVNEAASAIRTPEGVGPGSTDAAVRAAYPNASAQPAPYDDPPAHDLIVWKIPNQLGLRFEIDQSGRVTILHAGDDSILYIEGCA